MGLIDVLSWPPSSDSVLDSQTEPFLGSGDPGETFRDVPSPVRRSVSWKLQEGQEESSRRCVCGEVCVGVGGGGRQGQGVTSASCGIPTIAPASPSLQPASSSLHPASPLPPLHTGSLSTSPVTATGGSKNTQQPLLLPSSPTPPRLLLCPSSPLRGDRMSLSMSGNRDHK